MIFGPLKTFNLSGVWTVNIGDGKAYDMRVPGTLDESSIGIKPDEKDLSLERYTRKYNFEGPVRISRTLSFHETPGKRYFLEVERARVLSLFIDETKVEHFTSPSLSTPHVFEVTGLLNGNHVITFVSDNSYPYLPKEEILKSSQGSKDTQTNWNGLLGYVRLREETETFVERVNIEVNDGEMKLFIETSSTEKSEAMLQISSEVLKKVYRVKIQVKEGYAGFVLGGLKLNDDIRYWDEDEGNLYDLSVSIHGNEKSFKFGIRKLSTDERGRLLVNNRPVFLRGETDFSVWPETGYYPTDVETWKRAFLQYKSFGVNFIRFHSHTPPEEAFLAADELGLFLMTELSVNPSSDTFEDTDAFLYYKLELTRILREYSNHPSFIMMSLSNDCYLTENAKENVKELLALAKSITGSVLFSTGICEEDPDIEGDFYFASSFENHPLRNNYTKTENRSISPVNEISPNETDDFSETVKLIHEKKNIPVISYEVGQYAVLPDFKEIDLFSGTLIPSNLEGFRKKARENGNFTNWMKYVEVSGKLSRSLYKREVEKAMRTKDLSGISLLSLKDVPGFGMGSVGMMNSHMQEKGYDFSNPKRFSMFYTDIHPMLYFTRYTYEVTEEFTASLQIFNSSKSVVSGTCFIIIEAEQKRERKQIEVPEVNVGELITLSDITLKLDEYVFEKKPEKIKISLSFMEHENEYEIFVYPVNIPVCPEHVYETDVFDYQAEKVLEEGGNVFLTPKSEESKMPGSLSSHFSPMFFSEERYPSISPTHGIFLDTSHPILREFCSDEGSDERWFYMVKNARVIKLPDNISSIVKVIDHAKEGRNLSLLFECRCLNGSVLFSSMGLKDLMQYPEIRSFLCAIYSYMDSYDFSPSENMKVEDLRKLITAM